MKIVQFLGGLGNQMFQYAFYLALKRHFKNVKADINEFRSYRLHNGYELKRTFGIQTNEINRFEKLLYHNPENHRFYKTLRKLLRLTRSIYTEKKEFEYDSSIFSDYASRYYIGYWQNEKYFSGIKEILFDQFSYKKPLDTANKQLLKKISESNSVSIHIRRGDYVGHPTLGDICSKAYYLKAIEIIEQKIKNPSYFIFSNDFNILKRFIISQDFTI